jgi:single-strand DNA-binding protein
MAFTAEEIDYLDSRAESEAGRNGGPGAESRATSTERPSAEACFGAPVRSVAI